MEHLAWLAAMLIGCAAADEPTEVVVVVDAQPGVRAASAELAIVVSGSDREGLTYAVKSTQRFLPPDPIPWPRTLGLVPENGDASRRFEVSAIAFDTRGERVAEARVRAGYVAHRILRYRLVLEDACLRVSCGTGLTCRGGECVPDEIDIGDYDGGIDAGGRDAESPRDAGLLPDVVLADVVVPLDAGCPGGCDDLIACTHDVCAGTTCMHGTDDSLCTDMAGGTCDRTLGCQYPGCPTGCDDGNVCTYDSCGPSGCVHDPMPGTCNDADACTTGDTCVDGVCQTGGGRLVCDDGNPCSTEGCNPISGCTSTLLPDGTPCITDGCGVSQCMGGLCTVMRQELCDDGNDCTDDRCNNRTGECEFVPGMGPCSDGNRCTDGDSCEGTRCVSGPPVSCSSLLTCCATTGLCSSEACPEA